MHGSRPQGVNMLLLESDLETLVAQRRHLGTNADGSMCSAKPYPDAP